jgi:hypothetical protein
VLNSRLYRRFRESGFTPIHAASAARTLEAFNALESLGLVRIIAREEQESYFDVYGEPEGYTDINGRQVSAHEEREEMIRILERDGLWCVASQLNRGTEEEPDWETVDSVGVCMGYSDPCSPFENCYVPDLMSAAVLAADVSDVCV